MNILITGGSGFIGSNLVRLVLAERPGWRVVNLDKLTYAGNAESVGELEGNPRYRFVRGDIANGELVAEILRSEGIDAVMHLAAESHVDRSILSPAIFIETNVRGTQVLLEAARELRVKRFLHVSTDEVYGSLGPTGLFTEDTPLPVYGDGLNVRDWIHVEDHCRGLLAALEQGQAGQVYNFGASSERRNIDIVKGVLRHLGKPESLIQYVKDRPGHDRRYAID